MEQDIVSLQQSLHIFLSLFTLMNIHCPFQKSFHKILVCLGECTTLFHVFLEQLTFHLLSTIILAAITFYNKATLYNLCPCYHKYFSPMQCQRKHFLQSHALSYLPLFVSSYLLKPHPLNMYNTLRTTITKAGNKMKFSFLDRVNWKSRCSVWCTTKNNSVLFFIKVKGTVQLPYN